MLPPSRGTEYPIFSSPDRIRRHVSAPAGARVLVGVVALAVDAALGEPPARLHPVVGMGSLLSAARRRWRAQTPSGELAEGAAGVIAVVAASALCAVAAAAGPAHVAARRRPPRRGRSPLHAARAAGAVRGSRRSARSARATETSTARGLLAARDLVSRDTSQLDASELSGAAIQSLAENLSDSVVAPLLAYVAGGLPAAAAYRALNTADAMWGYRSPELLHRGWAAARGDDLANLVPARVTALLIAARSPQPRAALRVALRDHGLAPSPNGGWPMAAMAGGLGVRLVKRDSYAFNAEAPAPVPADIALALGVARG